MNGVRSTGGKEYTFGKKLGAFGRGLPRLQPFLKIAEEGLQRGYSLGTRREGVYLERIRKTLGGYMRMPQLFGPRVPGWVQEEMARDISFHVRYMPIQSASAKVMGHKELAGRLASKTFKLRKMVADALYEGRVTSIGAQLELAECFVRQSVDMGSNDLVRDRGKVLSPESKASEEFKRKVKAEMAGVEIGSGPDPLPAA
ncbi:MAG: hypothetical protein GY852_11580 [bacterium]|nr:hypothetical protein [bacterium]